MLPTCNGFAEDVVEIPDEEAKRKRSGTSAKETSNGRLYMLRNPFRDLRIPQEVNSAHGSNGEQHRKDDLVVDWVAVDVATVRGSRSVGAPQGINRTRLGGGVRRRRTRTR